MSEFALFEILVWLKEYLVALSLKIWYLLKIWYRLMNIYIWKSKDSQVRIGEKLEIFLFLWKMKFRLYFFETKHFHFKIGAPNSQNWVLKKLIFFPFFFRFLSCDLPQNWLSIVELKLKPFTEMLQIRCPNYIN